MPMATHTSAPATPWQTIKPQTVHESQDFELRFVEWPALDTVDRAEDLVLDFGEEIFDLLNGILTLRALNEATAADSSAEAQLKKAGKAAQSKLILGAVQELFTTKATGKTARRFMVDYFNASRLERNDGEKWVRLVKFETNDAGEESTIPNLDGLGSMNIGITTGLLWHLAGVHFAPLFAGRLSKAAEKGGTSSDVSSTLAGTG